MANFDHQKIETKWRKKWQESQLYEVDMEQPHSAKASRGKFYNLMMFPYPSAEGLHVGNMYAFTGADVYGRFKAMQGYMVFEPIGLDGFGIHSENYAISINKHPAEQAKISEKHFYEQLSRIGNRFSWNNRLETYDPEYYQWTQWLFVQMFKHNLAYRKKAQVNWCPSCKTVLADEQVEAGVCERCQTATEKKETYQWFFKITDYAQRLLDNIDKIDWPEKIKISQRNWIGRKEGINITYKVEGSDPSTTVTVFTTRPDTNFGATFVVLGAEHPLAQELAKKDKKIKDYIEKSLQKSEIERIAEGREKTGVDTGLKAINDLSGREMPIYVTDFVLGHVGTGAVVGVPGHDKRDFEFAKEFGLEVIRVVVGKDGDKSAITKIEQVQEDEGKMINSGFLDGMDIHEATEKIMDYLEEKGVGKRVVSYRLRDWCISRQRYWGPPIPMIECKKCGWVAEKIENLPVKLPYVKDSRPRGDGKTPLERASKEWLEAACPECGRASRRAAEIIDNFVDSAWYYLRYPSVGLPTSGQVPFDPEITKKWLPVDAYIGGAEHAVLHLLYSRFVWMALQDWGCLPVGLGPEPFPFLYGHGLIIKDGAKMSKSRGNIVNPDEYIEKYGTDALRLYLMFIGPYDQGGDFQDTGMVGMRRFLDRVWKIVSNKETPCSQPTRRLLVGLRHKTVKKVTEAMKNFRFNVAIAGLMEHVNGLSRFLEETEDPRRKASGEKIVRSEEWVEAIKALILMLAPFAPFTAEELWSRLKAEDPRFGKPIPGVKWSVHQQLYPKYEEKLAKSEKVTVVVQVNGKLRAKLELDLKTTQDKAKVFILAKANNHIKTYIKDKKIVKEIFVAGKLVNLVVK